MPRAPQGNNQHLFVFTLNNPKEKDEDKLASLVLCEAKCTYIAWEHEVGENGTPHLQGFFRTKIKV